MLQVHQWRGNYYDCNKVLDVIVKISNELLFIGDGVQHKYIFELLCMIVRARDASSLWYFVTCCLIVVFKKNIENACLHAITREKVVLLYSLTVSITLARVCMYVPIKKPLIIYH